MNLKLPTDDAIQEAGQKLASGQLVAFPTETVYGLGANATDGLAVAKIFETKGRPQFNPLISHVANLEKALKLAEFNDHAQKLAEHFWPGPLTLVLPKLKDCPISDLVTAGLDTIALRIPNNDLALSLLRAADCPVAAPSANISGHVSPTLAEHVAEDFANVDLTILDGGPSDFGIESTIVYLNETGPTLLRPGAVTANDLKNALGQDIIFHNPNSSEQPIAPGQLTSHYAPNAKIRLNATFIKSHEAVLTFGNRNVDENRISFDLSLQGDLREAAANLFKGLRYLDSLGIQHIAVMPIPNIGLGEAINDRLVRAAAPKNYPKNS